MIIHLMLKFSIILIHLKNIFHLLILIKIYINMIQFNFYFFNKFFHILLIIKFL